MICTDCQDYMASNTNIVVTETKMRVIVCDEMWHYPLTFYACCADKAAEYAKTFCLDTFGTLVLVAEVWDEWDLAHNEGPGSTYYPDSHRSCQMVANFVIKVGVQ